MKRWLGVTAAGLVGIALLGLPPRGLGLFRPWRVENAQEAMASRLQRDAFALNAALMRVRVHDSIRGLVATDDAALDGIAVRTVPEERDAAGARVLEASFRHDVASLPERAEGVRLAAYWVPAGQGEHDVYDRRSDGSYLEWHGGRLDGGESYCVATVTTAPEGFATYYDRIDAPVPGSRLGPCLWWGRFGAPGEEISRWLSAGGSQYTVGRTLAPIHLERMREMGRRPFGVTFGFSWIYGGTERCLSGDLEVCAALVLTPRSALEPGREPTSPFEQHAGVGVPSMGEIGHLGRLESFGTSALSVPGPVFMADLEREFGTESVRRFWTSDRPVDVAFREAFGRDLGEYTHEWLTGYFGGRDDWGRAAPTPFTALSIVALVALAAGVTGASSRRRQIG